MSNKQELSLADFSLDGEYGSQGAVLEHIGVNHFRMTLGTAPNRPTWTNKPQFIIRRHAKGNRLRMDIVAPVAGGGQYPMNEYRYSWSHDNEHWQPIGWETDSSERSYFLFPEFTEDAVYFGHQVPLSYEKLERMIGEWRTHPYVTVHPLGVSLGGRTVYRLEITAPAGPYARSERWGHYMINTHPGEHNAQWRMIGMVDWLLHDPQAGSFLERTVCHFVIMMCPDGPSNGWYRVNAQGVDMNRSYSLPAADHRSQAHEAYMCQRDLERLTASDTPVTSIWNMHTWGGAVEQILYPGPEFSGPLGEWTALRDCIGKHDPEHLVKTMVPAKEPLGMAEGWNGGPQRQFGVTGVLCEGGGSLLTKAENAAAGKAIIRGIADYYRCKKG